MRISVLGGDGFIGWPVTLHLSNLGHELAIVDNLSRRWIDTELGTQSLTPMDSIQERMRIWKQVSGQAITYEHIDIGGEYERLKYWLKSWKPDAVVHLAQQRAAPYSMKSDRHKTYTVNNNINATHNILNAIVELDASIHLVHMGTMGVYGYSTAGAAIPEGYLTVDVHQGNGDKQPREILYPADPGSIYHMTKCLDQLMFQFYAKNDNVRITDLHQGIVWGTHTDQTIKDEQLINRFDYDGDYGTVLNRFLIQAAINYPLTVQGTGGQSRAFIHIQDSVRCVQLALDAPPKAGERTKIFNQITEVYRIRDLAKLIQEITGAEISYLPNPRKEAPENDLAVQNNQFLELGLKPITLRTGLLDELIEVAKKYRHRIDVSRIPCTSAWTRELGTKLSREIPDCAIHAKKS